MELLNLQVEFLDVSKEPVTVTAIAADLIAFEAKFNLSVSKLGADSWLTHMFFLAWHACKRSKLTDLEFEAWTETVGMVSEAESKK
jgi:hypothetical protein